MANVLVTGGTGVLGRQLVPLLNAAGHRVSVGTRRPSTSRHVAIDLAAEDGLDRAVAGHQVVVHAATDVRRPMRIDARGTRRLVAAARRSGVEHLVYVSIVGVDRHPLRYYRAKLAAEQAITAAAIPHSILRTTQFHDLIGRFVDAQRPVVIVPRNIRFQVIETAAVARRLADLVDTGPAGRLPDVGGPEPIPVTDLARSYLRAANQRRPVVGVPWPGAAGRAYRNGLNLTPNVAADSSTWAEHLAGLQRQEASA